MGERVQFSILGPVRAWRGAAEIEHGPPQQRAVLVALLLAEGSLVSSDRLIDAVWGIEAPASALGIVRGYVHRLRKLLEAGADIASSVIRSQGNGYRLTLRPGELDLHIFEDMLVRAEQARSAGDTEESLRCLQDALGLWRGTALAGVRGEYAQSQRQRLDGQRLSAQAARITAELSLGALTQAILELSRLVAEYPLDERFRELFMLALYRSGRQAAALNTYREAKSLLAGSLGVEPGPGLQTTYQNILRSDDGLLAPPPARPVPAQAPDATPLQPRAAVAQLPHGLPAFVGRAAELAEVDRLTSGSTVVISAIAGMAGVGKTTFAVHWARQIAHRFPDGQLYLNLRGFAPDASPILPEHALRTLLESLGADPRSLPQDVDALAALYRTRLSGKHVLVLLDNARDAAQVRPLLPGAPGCLVIVTSRNRLAGLIATDGAHPLNLDVLTVSEARELLIRRLGQQRVTAEPDAVEEIISRCARLPLALAVTAARAATRSAIPLSAISAELRDSAHGLDAFYEGDSAADIRAVFSWSYHALTPGAARLFRLLALCPGPDITLPAAASLAADTLPRARRLLSELVQVHLIDETIPGRYTSHDLLRTYASELSDIHDPPEQTRSARQRIFDHYLHTATKALALTAPARILLSIAPAAAGVCVEESIDNSSRATAWFTAEQAVLLAAVEQASGLQYDVHCWQLAWAVANHLYLRGLRDRHEAVHRTAMASALRLGDPSAQGHVHRRLALAVGDSGRIDEARTHAERAVELFEAADDTRACAEGYRTLAWVAERQGRTEAALSASQRALAIHRTHDAAGADDSRRRRATAAALNSVGWCHTLMGQHQQALDCCRQALTLCQELGYESGTAETWDSIGYALHHLHEYEQAVTAYRNALDINRRQGFPWLIAGTLTRLGDTYLSSGRHEAARRAWAEGLYIMQGLDHADPEPLRVKLRRLDR
ncbi:AfsR/SARP family transcriptional regulator [Streptomyces sp. NPDC055210]